MMRMKAQRSPRDPRALRGATGHINRMVLSKRGGTLKGDLWDMKAERARDSKQA